MTILGKSKEVNRVIAGNIVFLGQVLVSMGRQYRKVRGSKIFVRSKKEVESTVTVKINVRSTTHLTGRKRILYKRQEGTFGVITMDGAPLDPRDGGWGSTNERECYEVISSWEKTS